MCGSFPKRNAERLCRNIQIMLVLSRNARNNILSSWQRCDLIKGIRWSHPRKPSRKHKSQVVPGYAKARSWRDNINVTYIEKETSNFYTKLRGPSFSTQHMAWPSQVLLSFSSFKVLQCDHMPIGVYCNVEDWYLNRSLASAISRISTAEMLKRQNLTIPPRSWEVSNTCYRIFFQCSKNCRCPG